MERSDIIRKTGYLLNFLGLALPYIVSVAHWHAKWHAGAISFQVARQWRATPKFLGAPISKLKEADGISNQGTWVQNYT